MGKSATPVFGRMPPGEFRAARLRLGLTQEEFAAFCGADARSVRRWERGQAQVPGPAARLVQALALAPHLVEALREAHEPWDGVPPDPDTEATRMVTTPHGHAWLGQWYARERMWHVRGFAKPGELAAMCFRYAGQSPSPDIEALYPAPPRPGGGAAEGRRSI